MNSKDILRLLEEVQTPANMVKEIARDFKDVGIEYCVIGGISLSVHNYLRYTEDVDILVSKKTFELIEKNLIGRGYTWRPGSSKNLYFHVGTGKRIPIDILVEGDKEGVVKLPNPKKVRVQISGIWYLDLKNLINFKLLSNRQEDVHDIVKLIQVNSLDSKYASKLSSKVRAKFLSLI